MIEAIDSPYLVPFDGSFRVSKAPTRPPKGAPDHEECVRHMGSCVETLKELHGALYAQDRWSMLLVFQALDAAGKDGTIRAVLSGLNPSGCEVYSFKQPTPEELDHDFLWRTARRLPERGRIGVFNRSYYEEVLVVRVHPEYIDAQNLPHRPKPKQLWKERFESIRDHEGHLARNGTVIVKFWLNVSKKEQKKRFLARIDDEDRNWKFSAADVRERGFWDDYMEAYEDALNATSRPWAPWYAIPADDKPFMRATVASILAGTMKRIAPEYPRSDAKRKAELRQMKVLLGKRG